MRAKESGRGTKWISGTEETIAMILGQEEFHLDFWKTAMYAVTHLLPFTDSLQSPSCLQSSMSLPFGILKVEEMRFFAGIDGIRDS